MLRLAPTFRRLFLLPWAERALWQRTNGQPYEGLVSKLTPNPNQYSRGTIRRARRYGFDLELDLSDLIDWYLFWGFDDPSHDRLVALATATDVVIDVGANMGITAMRMVRYTGRVIAVEADPVNFARAKRNLELNAIRNVTLVNVGVSDRVGDGFIERPNKNNLGMNRIADAGEPIRLSTIDALVEEYELKWVDLIKIDTEGHEMLVLDGAAITLEAFRPQLFVELDDTNLRRAGSSAAALLSRLGQMGYDVVDAATEKSVDPEQLSGCHIDVIARPPRRNA